MAFLTLNGVDVPVAAASGGARATVRVGGGMGRSYTGAAHAGARALKREWRFRTRPLPRTEVPAWVGLLEGAGHSWAFDVDTYSSRQLAVSLTQGNIIIQAYSYAGENPKHPPHLNVGTSSGAVEWQLGAGFAAGGHTLVFWANHPDYPYKHHVQRSDGARWRNGVRADTTVNRILALTPSTGVLRIQVSEWGATTWAASQVRALGSVAQVSGHVYEAIVAGTTTSGACPLGTGSATTYPGTVVDGTVTWRYWGAQGARISDMAVLPYLIPDAWAPALYTWHNVNPWSALPRLTATGDFCPETSLQVRGEVLSAEVVRWQESGTWCTGEALEFVLKEV